ncbi:MAG: hypothetical protein IJQ26_07060, partial [Lachnospiraceae bacterium]|nr:hypothetical protein [Lachnospiraceae bacterium]
VFAFLDYEKAGGLVLLENLLMLFFWVFAGVQLALLFRRVRKKKGGAFRGDENERQHHAQ